MKMERFLVEEWMNQYETNAQYNIAETCVDSVSLDELFALTHEDKQAFLDNLSQKRLTYGAIEGLPELKAGIARLYQTVQSDEIVTTHGASGANHHVFYTAIEPGDHVIVLTPTYQQLYSIPESFGAEVECLHLEEKDGYLPNLDRLAQMVRSDTKMICINNPNNPTGALMPKEVLQQIVAIAKKVNAYVLCDEVYRHLTQEDSESPSIVDLYEKGSRSVRCRRCFLLLGCGWDGLSAMTKTLSVPASRIAITIWLAAVCWMKRLRHLRCSIKRKSWHAIGRWCAPIWQFWINGCKTKSMCSTPNRKPERPL